MRYYGYYSNVSRGKRKNLDQEPDIQSEVAKMIPLAFYGWNGWKGEQGLQTAISSWQFLILELPIPPLLYLYTVVSILFGVAGEILGVRWARSRPVLGQQPLGEPAGTLE